MKGWRKNEEERWFNLGRTNNQASNIQEEREDLNSVHPCVGVVLGEIVV